MLFTINYRKGKDWNHEVVEYDLTSEAYDHAQYQMEVNDYDECELYPMEQLTKH